jgi:hypothetical protein
MASFAARRSYGRDDDDSYGFGDEDDRLPQGIWLVAEAIKIKDGLFLGNILAVQDLSFLLSNKIAHVISCQSGFVAPKRLKKIGINFSSFNVLEAFTNPNMPSDEKDFLVDQLCAAMEACFDIGAGVLLYCFQDFGRFNPPPPSSASLALLLCRRVPRPPLDVARRPRGAIHHRKASDASVRPFRYRPLKGPPREVSPLPPPSHAQNVHPKGGDVPNGATALRKRVRPPRQHRPPPPLRKRINSVSFLIASAPNPSTTRRGAPLRRRARSRGRTLHGLWRLRFCRLTSPTSPPLSARSPLSKS